MFQVMRQWFVSGEVAWGLGGKGRLPWRWLGVWGLSCLRSGVLGKAAVEVAGCTGIVVLTRGGFCGTCGAWCSVWCHFALYREDYYQGGLRYAV